MDSALPGGGNSHQRRKFERRITRWLDRAIALLRNELQRRKSVREKGIRK